MKTGKLFEIDCGHYSYGVADGYNRFIRRVSRWVRIDNICITKRSRFWDIADGYTTYNGVRTIDVFRYKDRLYPLNQFLRLSHPYSFTDTDGEKSYISGYDSSNYYNPLLIEICESGERVRLYQELTELEYNRMFS